MVYHCFVLSSVMVPTARISRASSTKGGVRPAHELRQADIHDVEVHTKQRGHENDDHGGRPHFAARRPRDPAEFAPHLGEEASGAAEPAANSFCCLVEVIRHRRSITPVSTLSYVARLAGQGGADPPTPRFWRPVLYQLNYWPKFSPGGFAPPDPPTRSLARFGSTKEHLAKSRFVREARFALLRSLAQL